MNHSFKFEEKMKSRKIVIFVTSHTFSGKCVSQFWVKSRDFFSFHPVYPSAKGRRDLKIKAYGVIFHGEFDFEWIILPNPWKNRKVRKSFNKNWKKSKIFAEKKKNGRKIICCESFETVFAEVSDRTELILGGKRSFKVWRTGFRYVRTGFKYRLVLRALNTA